MLEMSSRHIKVGNQQSRINWHKQAMQEVVTTKILAVFQLSLLLLPNYVPNLFNCIFENKV